MNTRSRRQFSRWLRIAFLTGAFLFGSDVTRDAALAAEHTASYARELGRLVLRPRTGLSSEVLDQTVRYHRASHIRLVSRVGAIVVEAPERDLLYLARALRRSGLFKSVEPDYIAGIAETPNDTYFAAQWGLPQIAAPAAWNITTGARDMRVAVLDSGVDFDHPDLQEQLLSGYDFVNDDADPRDDNGHGTRMAGIIAARRNNGEGVVGVAPDTAIIPVKVLGADGLGPYSVIASGITYAADQGARIINLSLTGTAPSSVLQSAIDYATGKGIVLVAAAGNSGGAEPAYPAASDGVLAVGATDERDQRSWFSNYGAWLAFAAPGVDIVTTSLGGTYGSSTGTSSAAAFGSGVFALLFAADPRITREMAIERIEAAAADIGTSGWDLYHGWGRVDAYATLVPGQIGAPPLDDVRPTVSIVSPADRSLAYGLVPVDVSASDNVAIRRVSLYVDGDLHLTETTPPYSFVLDASAFTPGKHKLSAYAYDTSDNSTKSKSIKVSFTPGVGLLVRQAKVRTTSVSLKATFALPQGVRFDPQRDELSVTLTAPDATVFSTVARASDTTINSRGRAKATVAPTTPAEGRVRIIAVPSGGQPIYTLRVSASRLEKLEGMEELMALSIRIGDTLLSQSLTFRSKKGLLLYP